MIRNSDILFIYDAKMCNPNGDPDDENRPRMDIETSRNIVTDVRLKRYIRDYWQERGEEIFVATVDEKTVDATKRLAYWVSRLTLNSGTVDDKQRRLAMNIDEALKQNKTPSASDIIGLIASDESIPKNLIDVRVFGATIPVKGKRGEKGRSFTFTGPVQFNWGYSLNKVEQIYSNSITSTFAGKSTDESKDSGEEEHGTIGKDYRLYYSLLAFHGIISASRAKHTGMQDSDIEKLETALIKAIPLQATRSKIGQYPRLLVRVEYNDEETFLGDLRRYVKAKSDKEESLRDVAEVALDISALDEKLVKNIDRINTIRVWQDGDLKLDCCGRMGAIAEIVSGNVKAKMNMIS